MSVENPHLVPMLELREGERVIESFRADRATYWRDHAWMAVIAMAGGMAILWMLGNAHVWTGAIGGLAAILLRGWYVASDELGMRWDLTNQRLLGPMGRAVELDRIAAIRTLGSAVQVVTAGGDKHLLKFQPDREATKARIEAARGGRA